MDVAARLEVVERENDTLREKVAQLESLLGMRSPAPIELGLTASEARVFGVLMARERATRDAIMAALYADRPGDEEAELKIVDVFVCKMRKKLKPFDIQIGNVWGQGYFMTPEQKQRVQALWPHQVAAA